MEWYPSVTASTDNYISNAAYGSVVTQGEGIDLRLETRWILYGKESFPTRVPKGHWIVYRRYDLTKKSEYYSIRTHEGIGGPAYQYIDTLLRTRRVPTDRKGTPVEPLKVGVDLEDKYIYYFEWTINPKVGDHILEIQWDNHAITPIINSGLIFTARYLIKRVHDYRLENGNIQYFIVSAENDEVSY
jgi:hypothetical protein